MSTATENNRIAQVQPKQQLIVHDEGPLSYLLDTARFEHLYRIAQVLARSALTPKHLKAATPEETTANCFRVVNQAMRWGFDPFAVADESYVVGGKLAYQGKLAAAVVNSRAGLKGPLTPVYTGKENSPERTVEISGTFKDDATPKTIKISVAQVKTDNKMWQTNPDQKLFYTGATMWARRHCPEILLGVLTDHDLEMMSERTGGFDGDTMTTAAAEAKLADASKPSNPIVVESVPVEEPKAAKNPGDKLASDSAKESIRAEVQRIGMTQDAVVSLLNEVGAKGLAKLTVDQADKALVLLREMPDAREPGGDDE